MFPEPFPFSTSAEVEMAADERMERALPLETADPLPTVPATALPIPSSATGTGSCENSVVQVPTLVPVIPHCTEFKFYHAPEGMKRLRTKRKVALIFGYIGERYCGLQWNHLPQFPTVEEAILKALFEADMISLMNISNPKVQQLLNFERASRTDKGVHALCNVISVNLMIPYHPEYVKQEQERMAAKRIENKNADKEKEAPAEEEEDDEDQKKCAARKSPSSDPHAEATLKYSMEEGKRLLRLALPDDIHLYDMVPVTRSFNAYLCCSGRRYEYILPTFALMNGKEYSETYFPSSVAPSSANLKEVGFKLTSNFTVRRSGKQPPADASGQPSSMTEGKRKRSLDPSTASGGGPSGRRSQGHFPKSKKRRMQDAEKAKALEKQEEENRNAVQSMAMKQEEEQPSSEALSDLLLSASADQGSSVPLNAQEETVEEEEDFNADVKDPAALEKFLTTHHATHFQDYLFESMILFRTIPEETMKEVAKYRISPSQLEHVRSLFHLYEGTHCYHCFTPGGRSTDASCHRYVKEITVSDPIVWKPGDPLLEESIEKWTPSRFFAPDERLTEACEEARNALDQTSSIPSSFSLSTQPTEENKDNRNDQEEEENRKMRRKLREHLYAMYPDGIEVVRIELDGQSFMLNQIRKMIGAVIGITALGLPYQFLTDTLLRKGVHMPIPMVPANGLFLSYLDFSGYGNRLSRIQKNGANGLGKEGIDVEALMPVQEVEEQERRTVSVILRNEMGNDLVGKWMRSLRHALRLAWKKEIP